MTDEDILKELSEEERRFKEEWNRVAFLIKRDLANVWTDEARKYFADLQHEAKRVAFIFRRLHSHYRANTPDQYRGYYHEMRNVNQFAKDIRKIQSRKEWVSRIHAELQIIIQDIQTEIDNGRKHAILVPHELDTPVNCYTDELPAEYVKDKRGIWSDASPYLDKIPIIRDFREHFGIVKRL